MEESKFFSPVLDKNIFSQVQISQFELDQKYLLQWIKHQNSAFSEINNMDIFLDCIQEFDQEDNKIQFLIHFILKMFRAIDEQYFNSFISQQLKKFDSKKLQAKDFLIQIRFGKSCFSWIQTYLQENLGKKLSKKYKEQLSKLDSQPFSTEQQQMHKQNFKTISSINDLLEVAKMMIYLSVQCKNKSYFIETICQLSGQIQNQLMNHVNKVQTNLQNILQVKEILSNILQLQEENQELQKNIMSISHENHIVQTQITQSINEQKRLLQEITQYNGQKDELFKLLHISTIQEFIQIYKQIERQTQNLEKAIEQISQRNNEIQKSNLQSVNKINQKARLITKTNDQITSLKTTYQNLKDDISLYDQFCSSSDQKNEKSDNQDQNKINQYNEEVLSSLIRSSSRYEKGQVNRNNLSRKMNPSNNKTSNKQKQKNILGQNYDIFNEKLSSKNQKSPMIENQDKNNKQNNQKLKYITQRLSFINSIQNNSQDEIALRQSLQQECLQINGQKQKYRKQLMIKLQKLYAQISTITKEITQLKQDNKGIQKKNKKNEKKLKDLKKLHQAFVKQYQYNFS